MPRPSQEICPPLKSEIGSSPDPAQTLELMLAFRADMLTLANDLEWAHVHRPGELATGRAAERAITTLGCDACKLSEVCVVGADLADNVRSGETETSLERTAVMLTSAPKWLDAARVNRSVIDPAALRETISDPERTRQALADGTLNATELLAGVTNEVESLVTKQDLPELSGFAGVNPDQKIELQRLVADNGDVFLVADASSAVSFKGEPLSATGYGILTGKLLERITQRAQDGKPQVQSPDNTMQKVLQTTDVGHLDEIRMSGKNRLYATVTLDREQNLTRIVILGSHGGDAATQRTFLNKLGI